MGPEAEGYWPIGRGAGGGPVPTVGGMSRTRPAPRRRPSPPALAAALLAVVLAALVSGCALGSETDKVIGGPASADEPSRVAIPSLGVDSPLIRLGLNDDQTVQSPPPDKGMTAGWFTRGARPGEPGAAVIIGHSTTPEGKAVFRDLHKVSRGTAIDIKRGDGKVLHFSVTGTETVAKKTFPARKVYGATKEKALRLVTCAGDPDATGRPAQNLIVYAALTP